MEWYPWYPALYRADTMHLTAEQDGIYRRLIDHYMETRQPLPDSDGALARVAGVTLDVWALASPMVRAFFTASKAGKLHHKRCNAELERQDGRNRKQSEKGKMGAEKRWKNKRESQGVNGSGHARAMAPPLPKNATRHDTTGQDSCVVNRALAVVSDFQKVYDGGVDIFPQLAVQNTSSIHAWLNGGCDVELDILPELRRHTGRSIGSWGYFTKGVANAKATREKPLPERNPDDAPIRIYSGAKPTWATEARRLSAKYAADAEREDQGPAYGTVEPDMRLAEGVRQIPG